MPTLNIEGRNVQVDDSFLKLSPDQQNATVDEIAKSFAPAPAKLTDAVTDIPSEVGSAVGSALQHLSRNSIQSLPGYDPRPHGELSFGEGLATTGKQILGVPELLAALPVGLARSVVGHLMAQGEHGIGTLIAPETAAKDNPQKMYETAKGDVDTALSAAASRGPVEAAAVTTPKVVAPTIPELKAAATANYESPALTGLDVKPTTIAQFAGKTKVGLDAAGIDENLAPKTHAILSKLEKVPDGPSTIVTGNNIKSLRQLLSNAAGEPGKEGLAASRALQALDEHIPKIDPADVIAGDPKAAGEALATANADYSAAMHAQTIDRKAVRAELRAAASNSGHNVANTIRQRMADILNPERPDLQKGFTPDELSMMEQIVRGTKLQNAIREGGNLLGGGGGLGTAVTAGLGAAATAHVGGIGAAAPVVGYALKALSNRMTLKQVDKLSEMIRSRAPLAKSSQKFDQAANSFTTKPTAKTYASAVLAARNLSTNLQGAGIALSPADLLRSLQSPSQSSASDKPDVRRPPGQ